MATNEQRRTTALSLKVGQAANYKVKGQYAIYLRRVGVSQWAVRVGWRVEESFDSDHLSFAAVAGLEGICHDRIDHDFGSNFEAAFAYYTDCIARLTSGRTPATVRTA